MNLVRKGMARTGLSEDDVMEDAMRRYLSTELSTSPQSDDVLRRVNLVLAVHELSDTGSRQDVLDVRDVESVPREQLVSSAL